MWVSNLVTDERLFVDGMKGKTRREREEARRDENRVVEFSSALLRLLFDVGC